MPYSSATGIFTRIWNFVTQFQESEEVLRSDLDIAFNDLADGITDLSADMTQQIEDARATYLYLGAKSAAPTVNNESAPLVVGNFYFDTTKNQSFFLANGAWQNAHDLPDASAFFKTLVPAVDAEQMRGLLELGSAAEVATTQFATAAQGAKADTAVQASTITAAGLAITGAADAATQRTALGLKGAAVLDVLDEDGMASDSAIHVPTQSSVKAYADTQGARRIPAMGIFDGTAPAAWLRENGFGTVTRNGTGDYSVVLTEARAGPNYCVSLNCDHYDAVPDNRTFLLTKNRTATGFDIRTLDVSGNPVDRDGISVIVGWPPNE